MLRDTSPSYTDIKVCNGNEILFHWILRGYRARQLESGIGGSFSFPNLLLRERCLSKCHTCQAYMDANERLQAMIVYVSNSTVHLPGQNLLLELADCKVLHRPGCTISFFPTQRRVLHCRNASASTTRTLE